MRSKSFNNSSFEVSNRMRYWKLLRSGEKSEKHKTDTKLMQLPDLAEAPADLPAGRGATVGLLSAGQGREYSGSSLHTASSGSPLLTALNLVSESLTAVIQLIPRSVIRLSDMNFCTSNLHRPLKGELGEHIDELDKARSPTIEVSTRPDCSKSM